MLDYDVWNEYLDKLTTCIIWKCKSDILIIGTDANSSMETDSGHSDGPSGCFGLNHVNESGKGFLSYLSINNLAVVTTFFKKNKYASTFTLVGKRDTKFITLLLIKKCFTVVLTLILHQSY